MNHADFWVGCSCIKLSYERYGAGGCSLYSTFETSNFENGDCDAPLDDCDHMCHYTKDEAYQSFSDNLDQTGAAPTPAPTPAAAPTSAACAVVDRSACESEDATTLGVSPACFAAGSQIADGLPECGACEPPITGASSVCVECQKVVAAAFAACNSQQETETIDNDNTPASTPVTTPAPNTNSGSAGASIVPNLALAAVWALCAIAVNV